MDLFLLDCEARLTSLIAETFGARGHRLLAAVDGEPGNGALVLGFDVPSCARMRTLHRVWAADDGPPAWLATASGSVGDGLLVALLGRRPRVPVWGQAPSAVTLRRVHDLRFEHLLTLERLVQGETPVPADASTGRLTWTA
jgi:hypothetical protein